MKKVVETGIKIDLHIHSNYSNSKDGDKTAYNTISNLPVLVNKLIEKDVHICAITDHDTFNYDLYQRLKDEEDNDNCIEKVLPGIEFSVEYEKGKVIHIITIFDDRDKENVKHIEQVMTEGIGRTTYVKTKHAYKRDDFYDILAEIGSDVVLIAHQKKSILSEQKPKTNDVLSLGKEKFNESIYLDYFDAYEFKNKRNEIYNKNFMIDNNLEDNIRFITGSDCHDWRYYPYSDENEKEEFSFTYIKALPTFRGLTMAVTDYHRIGMANKFFSPLEKYISEINVNIDNTEVSIPMSKGINVIIGDNSIGKSLLLNELTNYDKVKSGGLKKGYQKYLKNNCISIDTHIPEESIFIYNYQGEIREIFDEEGMNPDKYLAAFYPNEINASRYRNIVERELDKLYTCLENKFMYDKDMGNLPSFRIITNNVIDKSLTFLGKAKEHETRELYDLVNAFESVLNDMNDVLTNKELDDKDKSHLESTNEFLKDVQKKYKELLDGYREENKKINVYNTYMNNYQQDYRKRTTDEQEVYSQFIKEKDNAIKKIFDLLVKKRTIHKYEPNINDCKVEPNINPVDKYEFVSKIQIESINNQYIKEVLQTALKKGKEIDTSVITENDLKEDIKNYPNDEEDKSPVEVLKSKINTKLNQDFKISNTIIEETMDVFADMSSGFDAQMYFTLISGENNNKGIYIVDQPEDHISPKAIKEKVLDQYRQMGQIRQVIMVTHNPQFIVNLDVDNVIFLSKQNGKFTIESGALEYEDNDYSILKIVADNIDGGLQTIQGRMKRYEKNIDL